jgi:hypothetical protein
MRETLKKSFGVPAKFRTFFEGELRIHADTVRTAGLKPE